MLKHYILSKNADGSRTIRTLDAPRPFEVVPQPRTSESLTIAAHGSGAFKMIITKEPNGELTCEFKGLEEVIENVVKKKIEPLVADVKEIKEFHTSIIKPSHIYDKTKIEREARVKESVKETTKEKEPKMTSFGGKSFESDPNWSEKERLAHERAYFRSLLRTGVENDE